MKPTRDQKRAEKYANNFDEPGTTTHVDMKAAYLAGLNDGRRDERRKNIEAVRKVLTNSGPPDYFSIDAIEFAELAIAAIRGKTK